MTKREKAKWMKALDETEAKAKAWDTATLWDDSSTNCALCQACMWKCEKCPCTMAGVDQEGGFLPCVGPISKANDTHSRRPIFDAIRKMRRWLESN